MRSIIEAAWEDRSLLEQEETQNPSRNKEISDNNEDLMRKLIKL